MLSCALDLIAFTYNRVIDLEPKSSFSYVLIVMHYNRSAVAVNFTYIQVYTHFSNNNGNNCNYQSHFPLILFDGFFLGGILV